MFGSVIIDVAIGLIFVFVFVSLIASSVAEGIEGILKTRAMDLEKGIREILNDPKGKKTKELFAHPLIHSLFIGEYDPDSIKQDVKLPWKAPQSHMRWLSRRNLPSYIPAKNFAEALLDIIARGPVGGKPVDPSAPDPAAALDLDKWREAVKKIGNKKLERAVLNALDYSGGELDKAKANLAAWFDSSMDRVSGWYKRRVQMILFAIGLVVAVVLNIDALTTATRLMNDRALRDAIVALASTTVTKVAEDESEPPEETPPAAEGTLPEGTPPAAEGAPPAGTPPAAEGTPPEETPPAAEGAPPAGTPPTAEGTPPGETPVDGEPPVAERMPAIDIEEVKRQLVGLGFPMGWKSGVPGPQFAECFVSDSKVDCNGRGEAAIWLRTFIGWLITAFAVMFGAPFWFDLLGKIVSLRASGNPPVESAKEAKK